MTALIYDYFNIISCILVLYDDIHRYYGGGKQFKKFLA